jgi:hypothetical protein
MVCTNGCYSPAKAPELSSGGDGSPSLWVQEGEHTSATRILPQGGFFRSWAPLANDFSLEAGFFEDFPMTTGTRSPGRRGLWYTEEDWVDEDATAHCGPDD